MGKQTNIFLVMGAYGVGKSTISELLATKYPKEYVHINLDDYLAKKKKMPIQEFMGKVGYEKFYEESRRAINIIKGNQYIKKWLGKTLLIDIGSGSTFDYRAYDLTNENYCILLTANPEYIYNTREKCLKSQMKTIDTYKFWQFSKEKDKLYDNCEIKVDVAYLTPEQIANIIDTKIKNFKSGKF